MDSCYLSVPYWGALYNLGIYLDLELFISLY
jgi:hypothetical protein